MDFSLIIPIIVSSILSSTIPIIVSLILSLIITSTWQLCCAVIFRIYHNDSQQYTLQHISQYISSKQD